jgi:hypothetical protein
MLIYNKNARSIISSEIYLQKSVVFLCSNNEQTEKEYRKKIPFIIPSKIK